MDTSFIEICQKLLPICFFADKVVGNIYQIYSISVIFMEEEYHQMV